MKCIAIGFYGGLGDIMSAIPALDSIKPDNDVYVFVKSSLLHQCRDFLTRQLPGVSWVGYDVGVRGIGKLFSGIFRLGITELYISPHAPAHQSSRKIPIFALLLRALSLGSVKVRGHRADQLSFLYTQRSSVPRNLKLRPREWAFLSSFDLVRTDPWSGIELKTLAPESDVFIHYGGSAANKLMNRDGFVGVVNQLSRNFSVTVSASKEDMEYIKSFLHDDVTCFEGTISELIEVIANSKVVLTHDTGFAHVAGLLEKPQIVFFGPTDPDMYLPANSRAIAYVTDDTQFLDCMPCGQKHCSRVDGKHCLGTVDELRITTAVRRLLAEARLHPALGRAASIPRLDV